MSLSEQLRAVVEAIKENRVSSISFRHEARIDMYDELYVNYYLSFKIRFGNEYSAVEILPMVEDEASWMTSEVGENFNKMIAYTEDFFGIAISEVTFGHFDYIQTNLSTPDPSKYYFS